ncbi:DUF1365 domain-containing protein [Roseibium sp. CAU 1637]|uniref:DUF1365 domain-containing protein n=1 Tax=Roseibium limicola TaxID=2816037 RepID=A0A939ELG2_9HYPH|nr:DUF1365 domain-containing protein [Roseibium limicola]MBO0344607.1 DUF1365 domain-containing protein [Roseibium limicola]
MSANDSSPAAAASLYVGPVMHQRMKPKQNRFSYSVFSLLIDLDRLDEADGQSRLFSIERFNLVSFYQKDHGPRDGANLRAYVDQALGDKGVSRPHQVLLLAYPRVCGHAFNPLAVYFAYDKDHTLTGVIYEVRNTFGDLHSYVLPVTKDQLNDAGLRQEQDKQFYVSPFVDMEQHYSFRLMPPGKAVRVRILEEDAEGPLLAAMFHGTRTALTSANLARLCAHIPFLGLKVVAAIHWQAFKIWRMGVRFHKKPEAAVPTGEDRTVTQTSRAA